MDPWGKLVTYNLGNWSHSPETLNPKRKSSESRAKQQRTRAPGYGGQRCVQKMLHPVHNTAGSDSIVQSCSIEHMLHGSLYVL